MQVTFVSIVLNEAPYIEANVRQHIAYCDRWIIVEGADRNWPGAQASPDGFSIDGTSEILTRLALEFPKIELVRHGWAADKSELRNCYADVIRDDGIVVVFDADEFLRHSDLARLLTEMDSLPGCGCIRLPHVHFWHNPSQVITGGYYNVPHHRAYRWAAGSRYGENHNHPIHPATKIPVSDMDVRRRDRRLVLRPDGSYTHDGPCWLHYGFIRSGEHIAAKNQYYKNRGEGTTRPDTTKARAVWFDAEVDQSKYTVLPWSGPWPEIFGEQP